MNKKEKEITLVNMLNCYINATNLTNKQIEESEKFVGELLENISVTRCCTELKDKKAPTFEQWKKDNFTSEINIHKCLKNGRTWGSTEIYSLYNWLYK